MLLMVAAWKTYHKYRVEERECTGGSIGAAALAIVTVVVLVVVVVVVSLGVPVATLP